MKKQVILIMLIAGLCLSFTSSSSLMKDEVVSNAIASTSIALEATMDFKCACNGTITVDAKAPDNSGWEVKIVEVNTGIVRFSTTESGTFNKTIPGQVSYLFTQTSPGAGIVVSYDFCGADGGWWNAGNTSNVEFVGCS